MDAEFDAARVADHLVRLRDESGLLDEIARSNRKKAVALFDGTSRSRDVAAIYDRVLAG